jgi:hypothetical protein
MLLHLPTEGEDVVEVNIAKQRNGPVGPITLVFRKKFMRFENFAVASPFESTARLYQGAQGNGIPG